MPTHRKNGDMDISRVMAELSTLELEGIVARCAGGYIRG